MASSKGISPIIAAVLLVAVSLGVVGVFSGWAPELIQSLTQSTSDTADRRIECDQASIEISSAAEQNENTLVTLRNRGNVRLENVTVAGFQGDVLQNQTDAQVIDQGKSKNFNISGETGLDRVSAFSARCGSVTDQTQEIS